MTDELRFERVIDAPPDPVFEAFTTDGGQQAFYGQDDPGWIVESDCDLRAGGVWTVTFGLLRSHLYRHRHVFEVIDRPRRLVLATTEFRADGSSFDFATEFRFEEQDGTTLMTMTQTGFPTAELRDEHGRGLPNAFTRLQRAILAGAGRDMLDRLEPLVGEWTEQVAVAGVPPGRMTFAWDLERRFSGAALRDRRSGVSRQFVRHRRHRGRRRLRPALLRLARRRADLRDESR